LLAEHAIWRQMNDSSYSDRASWHSECLSRLCNTHTHHTQICCHNTDYIHVNVHDRTITVILAKHCIKLPDDGSLVI